MMEREKIIEILEKRYDQQGVPYPVLNNAIGEAIRLLKKMSDGKLCCTCQYIVAGSCHKGLPTVIQIHPKKISVGVVSSQDEGTITSAWPPVPDNGWCGEWRRKAQ